MKLNSFHINSIVNDNNITLKKEYDTNKKKGYSKEININQTLKEFYDKIKKHKLEGIVVLMRQSR